MAWHGMAWHGMAWHGMAWHGMVEGYCRWKLSSGNLNTFIKPKQETAKQTCGPAISVVCALTN
jgi:hypothetical protein